MGGYTRVLPAEDHHLFSRTAFVETIVWALGGHAAEELVFGEATTGATDDIRRATSLAREMVTRYGMSRGLGPMAYGQLSENGYLGQTAESYRDYAEETALEIDREVRELITSAHQRAREIVSAHRETLDRVSRLLVTRETLQGTELERAFGPAPPKRSPLPSPVSRPTGQPV